MYASFKNILVTGGAGFMGSDFVRYVNDIAPVSSITVFDSFTYAGRRDNLPDGTAIIVGDVLNARDVNDAVAKADLVVHFAAETHNDKALEEPAPFIETNILGTFNVLEAVRNHDVRFHHVSTDEVYGDRSFGSNDVISEASGYDPTNPYSASKAASDMLVRAWARTYGIRATISNSTNNFGPRQNTEKFIPRQIVRLAQGEKAIVYGDGSNMRNWLYVRDHSQAVWDIIENGALGESYLISGNAELSNREVIDSIVLLMGKSEQDIEFVEDRLNHDMRYPVNSSKLRNSLGWQPAFSDFEANLKSTIEWYIDNRNWWRMDI